MFSGKNEHWNEAVLNANFVESCISKVRKCLKPDNFQDLTIGCFVSKKDGLMAKTKISYEGSILNMKRFVKF